VRDRERQTDKLQQLRESFYADAGEFIGQLRRERQRAADRAEDPFDAPEVTRLSDEIDTAETTVEAIFEKRIGKIVKAASFAAADLPAQAEGMTAEEQELFDNLVGDIESTRSRVLDVLDGTESEDEGSPPAEADTVSEEAGVSAADVMGGTEESPTGPASGSEPERGRAEHTPGAGGSETTGSDRSPGPESGEPGGRDTPDHGSEPAPEAGETAGSRDRGEGTPPVRNDGGGATPDRQTVRVTEDVGSFLGVDDREYELASDDVVSLPAANATPLLERGAAEPLE
jgi:DNA replication factor GINS